jgi:hypothetical protein
MAAETRTTQHVRAFLQWGGASPDNPLQYAGLDADDMMVGGLTSPPGGNITPINVYDPKNLKAYRRAGRTRAPAELAKVDLTFRQRLMKKIPKELLDLGCEVNVYLLYGNCGDISDSSKGWDRVTILPGGLATSRDLGDQLTFDDDKTLEAKIGLTLRDNPIQYGSMNFSSAGVTLTGIPMTDVVYSGHKDCGNCGSAADDGTQWIYASANSATGAKPNVYYSTNGGATWTAISVTTAAIDDDLNAIEVVGSYLVALCRTASSATIGGYFISAIDPVTGIPSSTFTKVTTGFVANQQPNDLLVIGPNEIYFVADAGIVYKSTDITGGVSVKNNAGATAQNLNRIAGNSECMVAVGASNAVISSTSGGEVWTATSASPTLTAGNAVDVINSSAWWVGGTNGKLYYTRNSGASWTEKTFTGSGTGAVTDVKALTPEVILFTKNTAAPVGQVWSSFSGGKEFNNTTPRVAGLPTFTGASRIALPLAAETSVAANRAVVVGTGVVATDGYIINGAAGTF